MASITGVVVLLDEELLIDRALKSAKHFCDEFVIVDNGCTDRTMEIVDECIRAWGLNARIYQFEGWLREARFFAFQQATCEWIVLADGDHIWQTDGVHDSVQIKDIVAAGNDNVIYGLPLVRLFYDYYHSSKAWPLAPPHRMVFPNKPGAWGIATPATDIPQAKVPTWDKLDFLCCWNVGIKKPSRILKRRYWANWLNTGAMGDGVSLEEFVAKDRGITVAELETHAADYLRHMVFDTPFHPEFDADRYGPHPAVIREEIEHNIIRSAFSTVEGIRGLRQCAGLPTI